MTGHVHACGLATLDVAQSVERLPTANEKVQSLGSSVAAGGPALNASIVAAALGAKVHLTTVVGQGVVADAIRSELEENRVSLDDVAPPGVFAPVSTILLTTGTGERAVASTNASLASDIGGYHADMAVSSALLVDGHYMSLCLDAARRARSLGIPVLFDGGSWKPGTDELLALVDVAVISSDFRIESRQTRLEQVLERGPTLAARTNGADPIQFTSIRDGGRVKEIRTPRSSKIVDTLGAGDVFHGALLGLMARRTIHSANFEESLAVAAKVSTLSCEFPGARGWIGSAAAEDLLSHWTDS